MEIADSHRNWVRARKMSGLADFERGCPIDRATGMKAYLTIDSPEHVRWLELRQRAQDILRLSGATWVSPQGSVEIHPAVLT